jgi:hypothetical protein
MALNPSGAISLAGPTAGQSIAVELGVSATATISLNDTNVRTLAQVPSGVIVMPTNFYGKSNITFIPTQKAIFAWGRNASAPLSAGYRAISNLVSSTGVVATDTAITAPGRQFYAGAGYGTDKAIYGYGFYAAPNSVITDFINLVSNTGVVASNTTGPALARQSLAAACYGGDKALFGFGSGFQPAAPATVSNVINLVSNTGVVASQTSGVGTARQSCSGVGYGGTKAIFAFGFVTPTVTNISNLVSDTGVVATDTPGVGTARTSPASTSYGTGKGIYAFGGTPTVTNISSLVSDTGVVATDTPGVGTARTVVGGAGYGGDKGIFAYGSISPTWTNISNLVSNTGVVATDTPGVGTARTSVGAGFSTTA